MKVAVFTAGCVAAVAAVAGTLGWVRALDAEQELAAAQREAAVRLFVLEYEAAGRASGLGPLNPPLSPALAAGLVDAGWTPAEAVAVEMAVSEMVRLSRPIGPAVSPPYGIAWQLELARCARHGAPYPGASTNEAAVGSLALAILCPSPPRQIREVLKTKVAGDDKTVVAALRELRSTARSRIRKALSRLDEKTTSRIADSLAFGSPPMGLAPEELDTLLAEPLD